MNLRSDDKFVEDKGWHIAAETYKNFFYTKNEQHILFLKLDVGYNTPVIIKYLFWQRTAKNNKYIYAHINYGKDLCPTEIEKQSNLYDSDIGEIPEKLAIIN